MEKSDRQTYETDSGNKIESDARPMKQPHSWILMFFVYPLFHIPVGYLEDQFPLGPFRCGNVGVTLRCTGPVRTLGFSSPSLSAAFQCLAALLAGDPTTGSPDSGSKTENNDRPAMKQTHLFRVSPQNPTKLDYRNKLVPSFQPL